VPDAAVVDYTIVDRPASWNALCTGTLEYNGFYGDGIVNAGGFSFLAYWTNRRNLVLCLCP